MHQLKVVAHTLKIFVCFSLLIIHQYSQPEDCLCSLQSCLFFPETFILRWVALRIFRDPDCRRASIGTQRQRASSDPALCVGDILHGLHFEYLHRRILAKQSHNYLLVEKTIHLVCLPATFIHRNIIKIKKKIKCWYVTPWLNDFSIY